MVDVSEPTLEAEPRWMPCHWVEDDLCSGCVDDVVAIPHDHPLIAEFAL